MYKRDPSCPLCETDADWPPPVHMETGRIGQNIDTELLAALDMDHWLK